MKNYDLLLFNKGTFVPIDNCFMVEGREVLQKVQEVQVKYKKKIQTHL